MVSTQLSGIHDEDILLSIFSFLPILDLARCTALCKQWHEVVTGSTQIWKEKRYTSKRILIISAEMRAILFALQLLQKPEIKEGTERYVNISYPCLSLTVGGISDFRALRDWQKVRCTYLSLHLIFAELFFSSHSPIDFSVLQKLNMQRNWAWSPIKPVTRAECAINCALQLCPNLRRLRLQDCRLEEGDLDVTAPGMRSLVSLELSMCNIKDLPFLRHCEWLREVSVVVGHLPKWGILPTGLGHLPASVRSLSLTGSFSTTDELSEALPCLPYLDQLSLSCAELDRLDFLRGCPQQRHLCLEYLFCPNRSELLNLCHLSQLETLDLPGNSDDLAFLSSVIPSLLQLDTLSVGYEHNVDYVLQDFPRLCSLSLLDKDGNLYDMSWLGKFDVSLYGSKYVCKFVHEVV